MTKPIIMTICLYLCCTQVIISQIKYLDTTNLIPNPGFEEFNMFPLGWYYKGAHYTEIVRFWSSPTGASPDAYGPNVIVPSSWRKNGFGRQKPYEGKSMSGITLYGCKNGKPHCREYLQVSLKENLIPGQRYELSFYYSTLDQSIQIDRLGIVFTKEAIQKEDDPCLCSLNGQYLPELKPSYQGDWAKFNIFFVAHDEAGYLIIGNFDEDDHTHTNPNLKPTLPYAYYYIDDVRLIKHPPIITSRKKHTTTLFKRDLTVGKTITLDNIYFDTDKTDFHPRSFHQLNELLEIMRQNPQMVIEIRGHTDDQGTEAYNQALSYNRSKAVAQFLFDHQIAKTRVRYKGFGPSQPIADNNTKTGRSQNRRVEFFIIKR